LPGRSGAGKGPGRISIPAILTYRDPPVDSLNTATDGEKRRGVGEGSIYRREDGRWVGRYEVEGKRRYVYGQDRESVRAKLTKVLADRDAGLVFDSRDLTVAEYAPLWLGSTKQAVGPAPGSATRSLRGRTSSLASTILDKLNALQVQAIYRKKLAHPSRLRLSALATA
jgi:hypothetical protein